VQERDPLPLGADSRFLVDELKTRLPTALEGRVEVIDRKANVVDSGPAAVDEATDRGVLVLGLEELDNRLTGGEPDDARTIGVVQRNFG